MLVSADIASKLAIVVSVTVATGWLREQLQVLLLSHEILGLPSWALFASSRYFFIVMRWSSYSFAYIER